MEKLNWKVISASPGYRSLKAAYVRDVQRAQMNVRKGWAVGRDKPVFYRFFKEVIGLVMKYANKWGISFETVLDHWEEVRGSQWWLATYQEYWLERNKPASVR